MKDYKTAHGAGTMRRMPGGPTSGTMRRAKGTLTTGTYRRAARKSSPPVDSGTMVRSGGDDRPSMSAEGTGTMVQHSTPKKGDGSGSGAGDEAPAFMQYYGLAPATGSATGEGGDPAPSPPLASPPAGNPAFKNTSSTLLGGLTGVPPHPSPEFKDPLPKDVDLYEVDTGKLGGLDADELKRRRHWLDRKYREDVSALSDKHEAAAKALDAELAGVGGGGGGD